jgi:hypothetical protein
MAGLTDSRDPMRAINMVRQVTRNWGGMISDKSILQFLSSRFLAQDLNQEEPGGLTSLGFDPHHKKHRFEDKKGCIATNNMQAMFGEKTFGKDIAIKQYTKKFFTAKLRTGKYN